MSPPPPSLAPALERYRRGDLAGARAAAEAALAVDPGNVELSAFAGLAAAQAGDPKGAIPHFRRALDARPGDSAARCNLAAAVLDSGDAPEAARICEAGGADPRLRRIAAYAWQQQGRHAEAAAAYEDVVRATPGDWESWNNLGNVRSALGDTGRAAAALRQAIRLRPDMIEMVLNLSGVLDRGERVDERRALMREAARLSPEIPRVQSELGLAEAAAGDFAAAEAAFRQAIRLDPKDIGPYLELGILLESLNRTDDLAALADLAGKQGPGGAEAGFLRAWALRRQGRFAEALPLAEATPLSIDPMRKAQLIGEIADRLGDSARAFESFAEMNRAALAAKAGMDFGPDYAAEVGANAALLTPEWVASWPALALDRDPPPPIFVLGFPRSGTTLLDTLLMNLPQLHVLEEMPPLAEVEAALGGHARLASLTDAEANGLRSLYFQRLRALSPPAPGQTIVDKFPLHMARVALIHRLFPEARIVFVERHPCDAVLSCFTSNFTLNRAMRCFTTLEGAARLYDIVLDSWTRASSLLPIHVHSLRYERLIADPETEMRALLDFLGLPWDERVLDNQAAAAKRTHIATASYKQVTEPLYARSVGRWERYRAQMAPVLPILAPWAERLGYRL
ncbi:MAG: tetratricopeptide repeat protein [Alphaproteobacteria bacterium]|nr:MAG: tetratricopeptide repeat protein [Alphaproteobacteria bacterium]